MFIRLILLSLVFINKYSLVAVLILKFKVCILLDLNHCHISVKLKSFIAVICIVMLFYFPAKPCL